MRKSFFNWKVGVNFLITLGIFSGLVWGTFEWLKVHTHHGKEVPVPNVVNMQIDEAVKTLENMGLEVEIDSFKYEPKYKPFQVLQTYPVAGSRVKEGRAIMLKVNPRTWAKVELPDLLNRYKGLAFSRLELVGLKIGDTIYESNIQKDAVLRILHNGNEIQPGTLLPKFSVVDLIIGSGPLRNIAVPNVVGLTVREAREVIVSNHFEVGFVDFDGDKDENAIVYYQDPDRGARRDQGMQVDIWASSKSPAEMQSKIRDLDKVYRRYEMEMMEQEEMQFREEFKAKKVEEVISKPKKESVPVEKPREKEVVKAKPSEKPKETPKPSQPEKKEAPALAKPVVEEKPKAKQIIIE